MRSFFVDINYSKNLDTWFATLDKKFLGHTSLFMLKKLLMQKIKEQKGSEALVVFNLPDDIRDAKNKLMDIYSGIEQLKMHKDLAWDTLIDLCGDMTYQDIGLILGMSDTCVSKHVKERDGYRRYHRDSFNPLYTVEETTRPMHVWQ